MGSCRLFFLTLGSLLLAGCYSPVYKEAKPPPRAVGPPTAGPPGRTLPVIARNRDLVAAHVLPDPRLTPGAVFDRPQADLCRSGYTKTIRNVSAQDKAVIYRAYGITHRKPGEYEIDHLVSLELGGSNDRTNLWPQSYVTKPWNAHVKDRLENVLHQRVCSGQETISQAQEEIRGDWTAAYRKYLGGPATYSGAPDSAEEQP